MSLRLQVYPSMVQQRLLEGSGQAIQAQFLLRLQDDAQLLLGVLLTTAWGFATGRRMRKGARIQARLQDVHMR